MNESFVQQYDAIPSESLRTEDVLATVINQFIGAYPKIPLVYRISSLRGFQRVKDFRYEMNLEKRWKGMQEGQLVYVWSRLWWEKESEMAFAINCFSPARVYINGSLTFVSNLNEELFPDRKTIIRSKLRQGWNHVVLEFTKTGTGCGGTFGTGRIKGAPVHFLTPIPQREGQEGWVYSEPQDIPWDLSAVNWESKLSERSRWFPEVAWTQEELKAGCFGRIFAPKPKCLAYAWTKLEQIGSGSKSVVLKGEYNGAFRLFINGMVVHECLFHESGKWEATVELPFGTHDVIVESVCGIQNGQPWDFTLTLDSDERIRQVKAYQVEGLQDYWLYLGPFRQGSEPEPSALCCMERTFLSGEEQIFWRADLPDAWARPFLETPVYGRWNYPLGVALYGILRAGEELGNSYYADYAVDFIEQCTSMYSYSMWDLQQFGAPGTNHQLALMDSLDDCGSFGAAMLEAAKLKKVKGFQETAEQVARYITEIQSRLPDGALYRAGGGMDFWKDTMWCDDLYMSTPFLSKYYELTGDITYLNDAANQFLMYRKWMFRSDLGIMHHVYDLKFNKPNGVSWGRGNGWVIFSLTELLEVMPENHVVRSELLQFFIELCNGYASLQGKDGLWYQVLTDPQSFIEASCTSMFIYAFARGVRNGWLLEPEKFIQSVFRGWNGLVKACIDKHGNVYGVCQGSGYSFSPQYYKEQLTWQINDLHGIGIILLAGLEVIKLRQYLEISSY